MRVPRMYREDHPRSRGEYLWPCCGPRMTLGSSPLSRGILLLCFSALQRAGIIPALAGNTPLYALPPVGCWDHPRSRGEYLREADHLVWYSGSSPLSRGILGHIINLHRIPRIIPALAGNTGCGGYPGSVTGDHPRSRGEYFVHLFHEELLAGSSPLSRGIRGTSAGAGQLPGIIPALAGNTGRVDHSGGEGRDHPRSRGEYSRLSLIDMVPLGSSPLSRGIPCGGGLCASDGGIIPALAGNTPATRPHASGAKDHPRSRGEYPFTGVGHLPHTGSSPLSRGILPCHLSR